MNVAIVNRTNLKNYGSVLQVYALCEAVRKIGYDAEVIWQSGNMSKNYDLRLNKAVKIILKLLTHPTLLLSTIRMVLEVKDNVIDFEKARKFDEFVTKNFKQTFYSPGEIKDVAASDKYFKFLCGSDQIWCTTTLYPDPMMYLRFAPKIKRIAYAPSLGRNYIPDYNKATIKKYINDIPYISVREDVGRELIKELTGRETIVVADPTLLMRSFEWKKLKIDVPTPQKYLLCYFLDEPSNEVKSAIGKYAKDADCDIVALGKLPAIGFPKYRIHRPVAGPGEFLSIVEKATMVVTDSYHGMLFAINYHKKFWAVERAYSQFDQSSRQLTVLSRLGLKERYVRGKFDLTDIEIDYGEVQAKIDAFVTSSMDYLRKSLE